jgi:hypothetical protein
VSHTKRAFYSVAVDGGAVGSHLMRGHSSRQGEVRLVAAYVILSPITFNTGATFDIGTVSNPTGLFQGVDPSYFPGVEPNFGLANSPDFVHTSYQEAFQLGISEPYQLTVNGADLLSGVIELIVEASWF